jgi:hypothetical protein
MAGMTSARGGGVTVVEEWRMRSQQGSPTINADFREADFDDTF